MGDADLIPLDADNGDLVNGRVGRFTGWQYFYGWRHRSRQAGGWAGIADWGVPELDRSPKKELE